jgi:hypothetical protein
MNLGALCSYEEEDQYATSVVCDGNACLLEAATGESARCFFSAPSIGRCEMLNAANELVYHCTETGTTPITMMCMAPFTFEIADPLPDFDSPSSISVSVPDGGEYMPGLGNSVTYQGSLSSPATRSLLEDAIAGAVSQQRVPASLGALYTARFGDAEADAAVIAYLAEISALDATTAVKTLLDDVQAQSTAAAEVLVLLLPDWILGLAAEPREELSSPELALLGSAMHQINDRREQLVQAAQQRLEAYREAQKNSCISISCLFTMAGFPDVLQDAIQDVDHAWIGGLLSGAGARTAAAASLAAVIASTGGTSISLIFPHAGSIALTATVGGFAALPVAVITIAAVATYMAVDNLITAEENERAFNTFIDNNTARLTDLDAFIGRDYASSDPESERLLGEIYIASQKLALEVFQ